MYRWVPDNEARTKTEPAPSDLLKATGMLRVTRRAEPATDLSRLRTGMWQGVPAVSFANCQA